MNTNLQAFQTLSIIIPAYNEKATIENVIRSVSAVPIPLKREIVVVDDFSTDGTREVLSGIQAPAGTSLRVVMHEQNRGKGAAIRTGLAQVTGDIVLVQDADLEYDPAIIHGCWSRSWKAAPTWSSATASTADRTAYFTSGTFKRTTS